MYLSNDYVGLPVQASPGIPWHTVEVPRGYVLYKAMQRTDQLLQSPDHPHATKVSWYSTKAVADLYATQSGQWVTYEFQTLKPLQLLLLSDSYNLRRLHAAIHKHGSEAELTVFRATTGLGWTYEQQASYFREAFKDRKPLAFLPMPTSRMKVWTRTYTGPAAEDLHRVSVSFELDRELAALVCKYAPGLDGYICHNVPTFIVKKAYVDRSLPVQYLHEEVMLCRQASAVEFSVAGYIPSYMGFQGAIVVDQDAHRITKVLPKGHSPSQHEVRTNKYLQMLRDMPRYFALYDEVDTTSHSDYVKLSRPFYASDLQDYLAHPQRTDAEVFAAVAQVYGILDVCKRIRLLHYDTKLRNFLVSQDGSVRLGDFGGSAVMNAHVAKTEPFKITYFNNNTDLKNFHCHLVRLCLQKTHLHALLNVLVTMEPLLKLIVDGPDFSCKFRGFMQKMHNYDLQELQRTFKSYASAASAK